MNENILSSHLFFHFPTFIITERTLLSTQKRDIMTLENYHFPDKTMQRGYYQRQNFQYGFVTKETTKTKVFWRKKMVLNISRKGERRTALQRYTSKAVYYGHLEFFFKRDLT